MKWQQAQYLLRHWSKRAWPVAVTILGLLVIRAALASTTIRYPTPSHHRVAEASARGQTDAGRWRALSPAVAITQPTATATTEAPLRFLGIGGPLEPIFGITDTASITGTLVVTPTAEVTPSPTPIPPRTEVIEYTVQKGDNVFQIAQMFNVSQDTIIWANYPLEMDPDLLNIDQVLRILPVTGVEHTVKAGETLEGIAKRYQVTPEAITGYEPNKLSSAADLHEGQVLIIPDGIKPFEPHLVYTRLGLLTTNAKAEPGKFVWPTHGAITQYFDKNTHHGLDIANKPGTPILAAGAGTIIAAGWKGSLGNAVFIDHGNGYQTWYGHLQAIYVQAGQAVKRGQQIGEMGNTGRSTGPHLHFVVRVQGGAVNPIRYLPK